MYERSYGYLYAELGEHPSAPEIAKAIRRDVRRAVDEGLLPSRWTYSVRSDTYSGGQAIDLEVRDCADAWQPCDGGADCHNDWCSARNDPKYAHAASDHVVLTDEARAARITLDRIHGAYNHDGSEHMVDYFDVRYYGHVEFESESSARFRVSEKERLASRKAERDAARVVGRVANFKRDGSRVVHALVEVATSDGGARKAFACGARSWRGPSCVRVPDDTPVTCSRCSRRV